MNKIYILLGSNIGKREEFLRSAIDNITLRIGSLVSSSSIYSTAPWGFKSENYFLNQAICVESDLEFDSIMNILLSIEKELGRKRDVSLETYSSRNIDLDIVMIDNRVWSSDILQVPHPRMTERRFVLEPLNEIASDLVHPVSAKTISELLAQCPDSEDVYRI